MHTSRIPSPSSASGRRTSSCESGRRVAVFYTGQKPAKEHKELVDGCSWALGKTEELLKVEPLKFRLHVYLMPDDATHQRLCRISGKIADGYAHWDYITLRNGAWDDRKGEIIHELAHVLRMHYITNDISGLLDEGLSEWAVQRILEQGPADTKRITRVHMYLLALHRVFFDWQHSNRGLPADYCYATARSFAAFLIDLKGIGAYKRLCKEAASRDKRSAGELLDLACCTVYGETLQELEKQWRATLTPGAKPAQQAAPRGDQGYRDWIVGATAPQAVAEESATPREE